MTQVKVPSIGESVTEAVVGQWLKENGDYVEMDDVLCEIESEKATIEVVAEHAGKLSIKAEEGQTVKIDDVIAEIDTDAASPEKKEEQKEGTGTQDKSKQEPAKAEENEHPEEMQSGRKKVSPVAEKILKESGISANEVKGSGSGGKITKADALKAADSAETGRKEDKEGENEKQDKTADKTAPPKSKEPQTERGERRERMTTLRKTIARRLLESKHDTAMLTTFNEIDLTAVKEIRSRYKEIFKEKHDIGLGFMSFFAKAVIQALEELPAVNAQIDGDDIVYHDYYDIGMAVSTERGLVVPVIRNAGLLSLADIEKEVLRLANKARENKLSIDEMSGGTFSITNGGVFGSLLSTPIINTPQSAILGMHTIQDRPVARNGDVVIRPMMYVALSYDHRLVDGRESVTFLMRVKEILEDPIRMLLDV